MNINSGIRVKNLRIMTLPSIVIVVFIMMMNSNLVSATNREHAAVEQSLDTEKWLKVSDSKLAYSRGGFILPNGVIIDISFEKRIFRNGEETSSGYFQIPNNFNLVKNGELNTAGLSNKITNSLFQSIIQNDLDNQTLQTINNINIDIKNLNNINLTPSNNQFYNLHSLKI